MNLIKKFIMVLLLFHVAIQASFSQIKQEYLMSIHSNKVTLFSVYSDNHFIGHSLWVNRTKNSEIKAQYFADKTMNHSSIYERYNTWKKGKTIISLCSGAFTNDHAKPKGITIDNGITINRDVDDKMDGLVIIYPEGGIAVSDLSEKNLKLPNYSSGNLNIRNEYDKSIFLKFARKENATVFQTQLLIYNSTLTD